MSLTTDPNDPELVRKDFGEPGMQNKYLVLSEEERAKGFIRPVRRSYIHTKCGSQTRMGQDLAETWAHDIQFYDGTFCCICDSHYPVVEFNWVERDGSIGPVLGT
jgi:hypothetical protein